MECVAAFAWNHWPDVVEYAMGTQRDFNPLDRFQDEQAEFAVEDVEIEHLVESGPLPGSDASGLCPVAQRESSSRAGDSS